MMKSDIKVKYCISLGSKVHEIDRDSYISIIEFAINSVDRSTINAINCIQTNINDVS